MFFCKDTVDKMESYFFMFKIKGGEKYGNTKV